MNSLSNLRLADLPNRDYQGPNPDKYLLGEELAAALMVSVALNQPLLVTGEPGTGKTQLAYKAAQELNLKDPAFINKPHVFHTKTTSQAKDLLYTYDAVRHFHDAGVAKAGGAAAPDPLDYIELKALGLAILLSWPDAERGVFAGRLRDAGARSSVVLIDEIDKAPRDFPNDLLHEIEQFSFFVHELGGDTEFRRNKAQRVVMILTSNSEKNLPEAFLRRCAFYHIPSPSAERLRQILHLHFADDIAKGHEGALEILVNHFIALREKVTQKRPATAELLNWVRILGIGQLLDSIEKTSDFSRLKPEERAVLRQSISVLVKTEEDLKTALETFRI